MDLVIPYVYEDSTRAGSYSKLEFPGTYYPGHKALDFGCGAGRSTRFLCRLGFDATGVNISADMVQIARDIDPTGDYRLIADGDLGQFEANAYDLVLSAFTFDNIPTMERKIRIFRSLGALPKEDGCIVSLVSSPDIYKFERASFSTKDFPENRFAKTGDTVKIIMTDVEDRRPVDDIIWYDDAYAETYRNAGLRQAAVCRPLARVEEPYPWVNETRIPPWVVYVLKR